MPTPTATIFLPYHALDDVILRGTRAAQPSATAVVPGTLYGVTDEGNALERSTGSVWEAYAPSGGGGGGAPAAHHATHEPGGSDPLAVDAAVAVGSLRTLGTGATQAAPGNDARFTAPSTPTAHATTHQPGGSDPMAVDAAAATGSLRTLSITATSACAGNDARLSDARTPTAHHATHEPGGTDALTALSAATLTSGTLPDARLSANVARRDQTNTFTADQTVSKTNPAIIWMDTSQPANARRFVLINANQLLYLQAVSDDGLSQHGAIIMDRAGDLTLTRDLYERERTTAMGHWISTPFTAAHYSASSPMVWTVAAGGVTTNRYALIGKTLFWTVAVSGATSGTPSASVIITLPNGLTTGATSTIVGYGLPDGATWQPLQITTDGNPRVSILRLDYTNFAIGTIYVKFTIAIEVL